MLPQLLRILIDIVGTLPAAANTWEVILYTICESVDTSQWIECWSAGALQPRLKRGGVKIVAAISLCHWALDATKAPLASGPCSSRRGRVERLVTLGQVAVTFSLDNADVQLLRNSFVDERYHCRHPTFGGYAVRVHDLWVCGCVRTYYIYMDQLDPGGCTFILRLHWRGR
jgi:hypothetical protein